MEMILTWLNELEATHWISIAAAFIAAGSLFVSWYTGVHQRRLGNDEKLLEQLVLTLERAYSSIAPVGPSPAPVQGRLAWLTAARHLAAFQTLRQSLKTPLYRKLCDEQEEHWRHQFYVLLSRIESSSFFESVDAETRQRELIDPKSAAIVFAFSDWPKERVDPLDTVSLEELIQQHNLLSARFRHFRAYIESHNRNLVPTRDNDA